MEAPRLHLRFGRFELDESRYALLRDGEPVAVGPKPLAILFHLARHRDRMVRKEELLQTVWAGTFVSDDAVWRSIFRVREALGESDPHASAIETVRGVGFRFVAAAEDLTTPAAAAPPTPTAEPVTSSLVGRGHELALLRASLDRLQAGAGGLALVVGEPGIGKTRLAEEVAREARHRGAAVHEARSREGPGAPALWLFTQILESFVETRDPAALRALLATEAEDLSRAVPAVASHLGLTPAPISDGEEASFRLLHALARFLARAARSGPQVLLLDDLQWADPDSLSILAALAPTFRRERILALATTREHELARSEALQDVLIEFAKSEALVRVVLEGLYPADVARLVEDRTGERPSDAVIEGLHGRTGGNPLFVREVLELSPLVGTGEPEADAAGVEDVPVPAGIRRVASKRIAALSASARTVLEVAAAIGSEFELPLLARACEGPREALLAALDEAEDARIVVPPRSDTGPRRFQHDLLREVLYAEIPTARRAALHRRVAEALRALHPGDPAPVVAAIAHHYVASAALGDAVEAARFSKRAGDLARLSAAHAEAAAHYERGLRALALAPGDEGRRRAELLVALGYAERSAGRYANGRVTLLEAAGLSRSNGDVHLLALAALGIAEFVMMIGDTQAIELLEEALAGLPTAATPLRVRLQSALAVQLCEVRGRQDEAARLARDAETAARGANGRRSLAAALIARSSVERSHPQLATTGRVTFLDEATRVLQGRGETSLELVASLSRHGALLEQGDRDGADAELERFERHVLRVRSPYWGHFAAAFRAGRALLDGRFDEAERLLLAASAPTGVLDPPSPMALAPALGAIRFEQGRAGEVLAAVGPLVDLFPEFPAFQAGNLLALLGVGREEEARRRLDRLVQDGFREVVGSVEWFFTASLLATVCHELEHVEGARSLAGLLLPRAGKWVVVGQGGRLVHGPVAFHLGLLALTAGDLDAAEHWLESAHASAVAMRSPLWRAHALAARSRACAQRAGAEARRAARAQAKEAGAIARELGMVRLLRQLELRSRASA